MYVASDEGVYDLASGTVDNLVGTKLPELEAGGERGSGSGPSSMPHIIHIGSNKCEGRIGSGRAER